MKLFVCSVNGNENLCGFKRLVRPLSFGVFCNNIRLVARELVGILRHNTEHFTNIQGKTRNICYRCYIYNI